MTPTELSNWLTTNDPSPLPPEDRATLAAALTELAISQAIIAKQSMLLDSYNADHADIESTLRDSLARLAEPTSTQPHLPFDFTAATEARRRLAAKLAQATTLRAVLSLAINTVRTIASR